MNKTITAVFFILFMSILISNTCYSDDAYSEGISGNASPMIEHPTIRMVGESVKIKYEQYKIFVDANFTFYNEGISTTVLVGFPDTEPFSPSDDPRREKREWNTLEDFHTYVENKEVNYEDKYYDIPVIRHEREYTKREKWKIKNVYFPSNSFVHTRVIYKGGPSYSNSIGGSHYSYMIGTGRSWSGEIGKSTFTFVFTDAKFISILRGPFFYYKKDKGDERETEYDLKYKFERTRKNEITWYVESFEPPETLVFRFYDHSRFQPWEDINSESKDVIKISEKLIENSVIEKLCLFQLKILRNEIYAKHGKLFNDDNLNSYFYKDSDGIIRHKINNNFKESDLNAIERKNIQKIVAYEQKLNLMK